MQHHVIYKSNIWYSSESLINTHNDWENEFIQYGCFKLHKLKEIYTQKGVNMK